MNVNLLAKSIGICFLAGAIASFFAAPSIGTWYLTLNRPGFAPPDWLFGPIWAVLYTLMGLALYIVWSRGGEKPEVKRATWAFAAQLCLNILWPAVFFGARDIGAALVIIVALWVAIALTVVEFGRISRKAAVTLFPYHAWVSFAFFLNYYILVLNR